MRSICASPVVNPALNAVNFGPKCLVSSCVSVFICYDDYSDCQIEWYHIIEENVISNPLNRNFTYTEAHYEYCTSERQREFLSHILNGKTIADTAEAMGITKRNVLALGQRIRKMALRYGYDAEAEDKGNLRTPGQNLPVKGVSTYFKEDPETGEIRPTAGWVKTDRKSEELIEDAKLIIAEMIKEIPPAPAVPFSKSEIVATMDTLMNVHVVTDYHLGMLAWEEETGDNWDTKIAEEFLMKFMKMAIDQAPDARVGVLLQLGDFLHFDGIVPVTPGSGHVLDADTRFAKVVRVAIRTLRRIVEMMLIKYPEVRIVMAEGNHDLSASIWMREMLEAFYILDPRVTVDTNPNPFGAMQHGKTLVAWHHGHKKRIKDLDKVIAGMFPELFGTTTHRYVHMGHFHHKEMNESTLMIAEMHPTISAHDAYSATSGYLSQRYADVITYHDNYGEVGRQRFTPALIQDKA